VVKDKEAIPVQSMPTTVCCAEFVQMISSQANEVSTKQKKATITGDHVVAACKELGLDDWVPALEEAMQEFKTASAKSVHKDLGRLLALGVMHTA
jgi:flagellar hook-basal body complex protein FliE